jgi:DNA invertase Pin-like site-specific DNA recombinase
VADYVSYLRVSTQRQGISGLGIEAQRAAVEQYVDQSKGRLLREFVEVETASGKARPILVQSISLCRRTKAIFLIAKSDRTKAALAAARSKGVRLGINGHALAARHHREAMLFAEPQRLN